MSEENVARIRRAFDAFTRGDLETALGFIDSSFEIDDRVTPEANPTRRGPAALVENAGQVYEVFGEIAWEPREIIDLDDRLLVRVRVAAKGKHTALPIDDDVGHVFTLKDGRATKLVIYRTWDEACRAAGLRE